MSFALAVVPVPMAMTVTISMAGANGRMACIAVARLAMMLARPFAVTRLARPGMGCFTMLIASARTGLAARPLTLTRLACPLTMMRLS